MNVLKAIKSLEQPTTVVIKVCSMRIENPTTIAIQTDYIEGLFNRNFKNFYDVTLRLVATDGTTGELNGIQSITTSRKVNQFNHMNSNLMLNKKDEFREMKITLLQPLSLEIMDSLMVLYNARGNFSNYSFRQTFRDHIR